MAHIHTNHGDHDATASAYIIVEDPNGGPAKALMHRHKKLGLYLQFGGHIELDETPWQTIAHELEEESGYSLDQFRVAQPLGRMPKLTPETTPHPLPMSYHTHIFKPGNPHHHFHTDAGYLLVTDQEPAGNPDDDESEAIEAFTLEELQQLPKEDIYDNVRLQFTWGLQLVEKGNPHWELVPVSDFDL